MIQKIENFLGSDVGLQSIYTWAIISFKRMRDSYLQNIERAEINKSTIQKIPDSIDPVYVDVEYEIFKEKNPDTPGFISVDYLDPRVALTIQRPEDPSFINKPGAPPLVPKKWVFNDYISSDPDERSVVRAAPIVPGYALTPLSLII